MAISQSETNSFSNNFTGGLSSKQEVCIINKFCKLSFFHKIKPVLSTSWGIVALASIDLFLRISKNYENFSIGDN